MPQLSLVIINYNTFQLTCNCLYSIQAHLLNLSYEIILVDNASTECDPLKFKDEFPSINLISLTENLGFGNGNNVGIRAASAPVILLLNSDTLVVDDAISQTYCFLMQYPDTGMVGCKLLNADGSEQLSSFIPVRYPYINLLINSNAFLSGLGRAFGIFKYYDHISMTLAFQKGNHVCEALSGAFMMIRKKVIEECGDFDPDFFMYCEDTEWCRNRISRKFSIRYYAEAAIIHYGGKSSLSDITQKQTMLSSFLYNYKTGIVNYTIALLITSFNALCNLLILPWMTKSSRRLIISQIKLFIQVLPYLFFDIPKYKKRYGGRPTPLRIGEYKNKK